MLEKTLESPLDRKEITSFHRGCSLLHATEANSLLFLSLQKPHGEAGGGSLCGQELAQRERQAESSGWG